MNGEELAWRSTSLARTAAQRLELQVRTPRWQRRHLRRALADDVLAGPAGAAIAADDWSAAHDALAATMRTRPSRFVLDPGAADLLRDVVSGRWPSAPANAADRANRVMRGEFDLLGYRGLTFATPGSGLDWHFDPVHGRHAPRTFWADVPYLDPAIGDHKIIWELNRHQHFLQLGRAFWLTGDSRYAASIVTQLESWLAANPPLAGINWASMLEIGFRTMSWTWALHFLLAGTNNAVARPWLVDMLVGLDRQMTHLEQNLSYYFSPNTHLTGEALALYIVGAALPELRGSQRWTETGRRILLAEIDRQILPDGGHAERSAHYQRYTLDFYLLACLTARQIQDGEAGTRFAAAATRLAEFTRALADDRGRLPLIGDDDGGMLWPLTGRACDDVRDSLGLSALMLGRPDLAQWGACEEVFWVAGRDAVEDAAVLDSPRVEAPASRTLEHTGYVVLRDERGGHAVFDTGLHGYLNGGHAHADALSLTLALDGRSLLIDPGTSTYTMDARLRDHLRSTVSHNTITIDGQPQSTPSGPFHWQTRADAALQASRHNPGFDWAEGWHNGYAPLTHRRAVLRTAGTGWIVVDDISGDGHHTVDASWHFDPRWMIGCDIPGRLRATHQDGAAAWLLHDGCNVALMLGDEDTKLGWYAPAYGTLVPTWTARITREGGLPLRMVTWIGAAYAADTAPPQLERMVPECDHAAHAIGARVIAGSRHSTFVLLVNEPAVRDGRAVGTPEFQTDARVIHYTERGGKLMTLDLVDVSHALALREGWFSVTASAPLPDLHLAVNGRVLELHTSGTATEISVEGGALGEIDVVTLNGREITQPTSFSTTPSQVISRARSNPASPRLAASFLSPNR